MFTEKELNSIADWFWTQFDKEMDRRFPITEDVSQLSDDELLTELGLN